MNTAIVTKVEFRVFEEIDFTELDIIPHSGKISEKNERTRGGILFSTDSSFKIAKSSMTTDSVLRSLIGKRAQYRVTDSNGLIYLVGTDEFKPVFTYTRDVDGSSAGFNGYSCAISLKSTTGCSLSE